jgi:hypothetical protein
MFENFNDQINHADDAAEIEAARASRAQLEAETEASR